MRPRPLIGPGWDAMTLAAFGLFLYMAVGVAVAWGEGRL